MEKVSVVIPIYNTELFIEQCIQSVVVQTYGDLEIILVDDGSSDQSRNICEKFLLKDERIKLFNRDHKGVSSARNYGLDRAAGTYIFFLDSDDVIHPLLIEKLVEKAEMYQADLVFCTCIKRESDQISKILNGEEENNIEGQCEVIDPADSAQWFHGKYARELTCIGSKLIRRTAIGRLRFDENMCTGEDTVFMYFLSCSRVKMVYYQVNWYYYRMHSKSITHRDEMQAREEYFKKYYIIRENEYQNNRLETAFGWEKRFWGEMQAKYLLMKSSGDKEGIRRIKQMALKEMWHPLFRRFSIQLKIYYCIFFGFPSIYSLLNRWLWLVKRRRMEQSDADVGILTFHCADDYGAMLQAFALKNYLCRRGISTDIIRYEPFFMTGRYWWIPYVPAKKISDIFRLGRRGWAEHRTMGRDFFKLKSYMNKFRKEHLVKGRHRKLFFCNQLEKLPYRYYIVGSDQIWNPEITYGLKKAYFGAFTNARKEKVIAYAASLGGEKLSSDYKSEFSELIKSVDIVSVREVGAASYVSACCSKEIAVTCDPVFLEDRNEWMKIEKIPEKTGYILVYVTQRNRELTDYVRKLSQQKGLSVVELRTSTSGPGESFPVDYESGPAEFLGYIHKADYIVTNSFHAAAFSVIYHKKFLVFLHHGRGARLLHMLSLCGLEERLYQNNLDIDIDSEINWCDVMLKMNKKVSDSREFLEKNLIE